MGNPTDDLGYLVGETPKKIAFVFLILGYMLQRINYSGLGSKIVSRPQAIIDLRPDPLPIKGGKNLLPVEYECCLQ